MNSCIKQASKKKMILPFLFDYHIKKVLDFNLR
jgi:hypothetical protein